MRRSVGGGGGAAAAAAAREQQQQQHRRQAWDDRRQGDERAAGGGRGGVCRRRVCLLLLLLLLLGARRRGVGSRGRARKPRRRRRRWRWRRRHLACLRGDSLLPLGFFFFPLGFFFLRATKASPSSMETTRVCAWSVCWACVGCAACGTPPPRRARDTRRAHFAERSTFRGATPRPVAHGLICAPYRGARFGAPIRPARTRRRPRRATSIRMRFVRVRIAYQNWKP